MCWGCNSWGKLISGAGGKLAGILDPESFATQGLAVPGPHPHGMGWGQPALQWDMQRSPSPFPWPILWVLCDSNEHQGAYLSVGKPCSAQEGNYLLSEDASVLPAVAHGLAPPWAAKQSPILLILLFLLAVGLGSLWKL